MSRITSILFAMMLTLAAPMSLAAEQSTAMPDNGKYEGIEVRININTATSEELAAMLIGVGQTKAEHIVAFREVHGAFKSADDLQLVKGIGAATVDKNRQRIEL